MTPDRRTAIPFLQLNRGELNGFLTQVINNLANMVILPPILIGTFHNFIRGKK